MSCKIEYYQNQEVLEIASIDEYVLEWGNLLSKQDKFTALQNPAFVYTWYRHYFESYSPLLVLAKNEEGRIIAVLPLAVCRKHKYVVCAGNELAEYHGWIASPEYEAEFLLKSLKLLKETLSFKDWQLNWLAPGTNLSWLNEKELAKEGIYFLTEEIIDPLWNLNDPAKLRKIRKRANVKRCFKQYEARGDFRYERILDKERMEELLNEFAKQSDFKKEAIFNRRLFENDPHIKDFLIDMQDYPDMNHFSVLWLDDKPIGFNHGVVEGNQMCLAGYTSYDPSESRNSPGKLHLIELARISTEEGYERIDLTPGKDAYKSRFANESREVQKIDFYFSKKEFLKARLERKIKEISTTALGQMGISQYDLKFWKIDFLAWIDEVNTLGIGPSLKRIGSWFNNSEETEVYKAIDMRRESEKMELPEGYEILKNDYHCLLEYEGGKGLVPRRELFQEALNRFARGDDFYSLVKDSKIVFAAWLRNGKYALRFPGTLHDHQFPEASRIVYDPKSYQSDFNTDTLFPFYEFIVQDCLDRGFVELYFAFASRAELSDRFKELRDLRKYLQIEDRRLLRIFGHSLAKDYTIKDEILSDSKTEPNPSSSHKRTKGRGRRNLEKQVG
ncbi:MAG: GNAT family N-acetyltransferase [Bacteroidia bacterium]|nr:GNAT family N-acetyltransferase [Bacteroidia bacterium]